MSKTSSLIAFETFVSEDAFERYDAASRNESEVSIS